MYNMQFQLVSLARNSSVNITFILQIYLVVHVLPESPHNKCFSEGISSIMRKFEAVDNSQAGKRSVRGHWN